MPDRKYVYRVELDITQATAAAQRLREIFGVAISAPEGGAGAPTAALNAHLREVQAAAEQTRQALSRVGQVDAAGVSVLDDRLREVQAAAEQTRQALSRVGQVDAAGVTVLDDRLREVVGQAQDARTEFERLGGVDAAAGIEGLNRQLEEARRNYGLLRNEYEAMQLRSDSWARNTPSRQQRAIFATNVEEVRKYANDEAAAALARIGYDFNIGERSREIKSDVYSDYTEAEKGRLGRYDNLREKQRFSAEEKQRSLELEAQMYDAELRATQIERQIAERRLAELNRQTDAILDSGEGLTEQNNRIFEAAEQAEAAAKLLAANEAELLDSTAGANERLAEFMREASTRQDRGPAGMGGEEYRPATDVTGTPQSALTVTSRSAEQAERLAAALKEAAAASEQINAALTSADRQAAEIETHRQKVWNEQNARVATQFELSQMRQAEAQKRAEIALTTDAARREAQARAQAERQAAREGVAAAREAAQEQAQAARQAASEAAAAARQAAAAVQAAEGEGSAAAVAATRTRATMAQAASEAAAEAARQAAAAVRQADAEAAASAAVTAKVRAASAREEADAATATARQAVEATRAAERERVQAARATAQEQAQAAKQAAAAQKQAEREAAQAAKQSERERVQAARAAAQEQAQAAKQAASEAGQAARQAATLATQLDRAGLTSAAQAAHERATVARVAAEEGAQAARQAAAAVRLADAETAESAAQAARTRAETARQAYAQVEAAARQAGAAERAQAQSAPARGGGLGMGGMLGRLDYMAGMAAGGFAMYGVGQLAMNTYDAGREGAQQLRMAQTYEALARRVGVSAGQIKAAIQSASQQTISDAQAMGLAAQVLSQKFAASSTDIAGDLETIVAFSRRAAQIYPDETGHFQTTQEVFARLIKYVREGNKELVDQYSVSNQIIAQALGTTVQGLASAGGATDRWRGLVKVLNGELERLGSASTTMADRIEADEARITDAMNRIKQATAPAAAFAATFAADIIDNVTGKAPPSDLPATRSTVEVLRGPKGTPAKNEMQMAAEQYLDVAGRYDKAVAQNAESAAIYEVELNRLGRALINQGNLTADQYTELTRLAVRLRLVADGQDVYTLAMQKTSTAGLENDESLLAVVLSMQRYEDLLVSGQISMAFYERQVGSLANWLGVLAEAAGYAAGAVAELNAGAKSGVPVALTAAARAAALEAQKSRNVLQAVNAGDNRPTSSRPNIDPLTGQVIPGGRQGMRRAANDPWDELQSGLNDYQQRTAEAAQREWASAADKTAREFEQAAEAAAQAFEDSLGRVPGLMGTSQVTAEDMAAAKAGTYREKADERLRQLADEVINKVETPEDPADWARRMGMDPNSDPQRVLAEAQARWADSSLFAGGRNMDLIRWDAVQAERGRQAASESGRQAILDYAEGSGLANQRQLFGANGQMMTLTIAGLVRPQPAADEAAATSRAETTGGGAAATNRTDTPTAGILPSAEDATAAATTVIDAIQAAFDTDYARTTLGAVGESTVALIHAGYVTGAGKYDWAGPILDAALVQFTEQMAQTFAPAGP